MVAISAVKNLTLSDFSDQLLDDERRLPVAYKPHIKSKTRHYGERSADGPVDPVVSIAEGASAQEREQNDVRPATLLVENSRQHRGFVGSL